MGHDAVTQARRVWRRLGVPEEAAREMAEELGADLAEAAADGRTAEEYVGGDVVALARTWAAERGLIRPRRHLGRVSAAALLGALPGGFTGLFFAFAPSSSLPAFVFSPTASDNWLLRAISASPTDTEASLNVPAPVILALYALSGLIAYAGSLVTVSAVLRHSGDSHRRQTVRAFAVAIPVIGLLATAAGVALAAALNFQTVAFRPVCLLILLLLTLGTALVRLRVVTHTPRLTTTAGPA